MVNLYLHHVLEGGLSKIYLDNISKNSNLKIQLKSYSVNTGNPVNFLKFIHLKSKSLSKTC